MSRLNSEELKETKQFPLSIDELTPNPVRLKRRKEIAHKLALWMIEQSKAPKAELLKQIELEVPFGGFYKTQDGTCVRLVGAISFQHTGMKHQLLVTDLAGSCTYAHIGLLEQVDQWSEHDQKEILEHSEMANYFMDPLGFLMISSMANRDLPIEA